jgi:hypothetical protein
MHRIVAWQSMLILWPRRFGVAVQSLPTSGKLEAFGQHQPEQSALHHLMPGLLVM